MFTRNVGSFHRPRIHHMKWTLVGTKASRTGPSPLPETRTSTVCAALIVTHLDNRATKRFRLITWRENWFSWTLFPNVSVLLAVVPNFNSIFGHRRHDMQSSGSAHRNLLCRSGIIRNIVPLGEPLSVEKQKSSEVISECRVLGRALESPVFSRQCCTKTANRGIRVALLSIWDLEKFLRNVPLSLLT